VVTAAHSPSVPDPRRSSCERADNEDAARLESAEEDNRKLAELGVAIHGAACDRLGKLEGRVSATVGGEGVIRLGMQ